MMTQCITYKSCERANGQLLTMLLMKINAKLGGRNLTVDFNLPQESLKLFTDDCGVMMIGLATNM